MQSDHQLPIAYHWNIQGSWKCGYDIQKRDLARGKNLEGSGISVVKISGSLKFIKYDISGQRDKVTPQRGLSLTDMRFGI